MKLTLKESEFMWTYCGQIDSRNLDETGWLAGWDGLAMTTTVYIAMSIVIEKADFPCS